MPDPLLLNHIDLADLLHALGYKGKIFEGICFGYAQMLSQSYLTGHNEETLERLQFINEFKDINELKKRIQLIEKNIARKTTLAETLSAEEKHVIDLKAFLDGLVVYHKLREYKVLTPKSESQKQDAILSSHIAGSLELEKQGGLAEIGKFTGMYDKKDLIDYFTALPMAADACEGRFTLDMSRYKHNWTLTYDKESNQFKLWESNIGYIAYKNNPEGINELVNIILELCLLEAEDREAVENGTAKIAFATTIHTTGELRHARGMQTFKERWLSEPSMHAMHQMTDARLTHDLVSHFSWLQFAALNGANEDIVKLLDSGRFNINEVVGGVTTLNLAIDMGHDATVDLLLESGAKPELRDEYDCNALDAAKLAENNYAIKAILSNPSIMSSLLQEAERDPAAALRYAILSDNAAFTAEIVALTDVKKTLASNPQLLATAIAVGNPDIVATLIDYGLDTKYRDQEEHTCLMLAILRDDPAGEKIAKKLIESGVALDALDQYGRTAAYYAAERYQCSVIQALVDHNANLSKVKNKTDSSPLQRLDEKVKIAKNTSQDIPSAALQTQHLLHQLIFKNCLKTLQGHGITQYFNMWAHDESIALLRALDRAVPQFLDRSTNPRDKQEAFIHLLSANNFFNKDEKKWNAQTLATIHYFYQEVLESKETIYASYRRLQSNPDQNPIFLG